MMASNYENTSSSMPGLTADPQLNQSIALDCRSASNDKAVVVGLYGVPGSGKTFLLNQLKQELGQEHFEFYDGTKMIANLVPGGLDAFQKLEEQEKVHWRQLAIDTIGKECADSGRVAVVAGHFTFWPEQTEAGQPVYTRNDLDTFTHILYLDAPAELVAQRCLNDTERSRASASINHLRKWQQAEKTQLRHLCYHHRILFTLIPPHPTLLNKVPTLLRDFRHHTEGYNLSRAESRMEEVLFRGPSTAGDSDSGALFWKIVSNSRQSEDEERWLKTLFSSPLGYSYTAFRQAALLYEETTNDQDVAGQEHVGATVVTCGLRGVWDKVLEREGLSKTVKVIGGGHIHHMYVWAFGDNQAIVVVGEEQARSKTMDAALLNAFDNDGLSAQQVLLPSNASPRLDTTKLPLVQLRTASSSMLLSVAAPIVVLDGMATEFLAELIGVEQYPIPHVQGHQTSGYRLCREKKTSIVALMRGGEAMAFGVNETFPNIEPHHLLQQRTVVLVDSVVNSGKTVVSFIVVVAGVVQVQSVSGRLAQALACHANFSFITLRLSDKKFTGRGTTDTGNRLFNTTHLP
ncbi:uracil phosphoribosyltransferase-domain-containing protein [Hyaloscypha sp. PMI_1271]|nr:uracil phosphoribosyltransferase-domain-containing protein [Hyaloscypha sp. PMI_1271]